MILPRIWSTIRGLINVLFLPFSFFPILPHGKESLGILKDSLAPLADEITDMEFATVFVGQIFEDILDIQEAFNGVNVIFIDRDTGEAGACRFLRVLSYPRTNTVRAA